MENKTKNETKYEKSLNSHIIYKYLPNIIYKEKEIPKTKVVCEHCIFLKRCIVIQKRCHNKLSHR